MECTNALQGAKRVDLERMLAKLEGIEGNPKVGRLLDFPAVLPKLGSHFVVCHFLSSCSRSRASS